LNVKEIKRERQNSASFLGGKRGDGFGNPFGWEITPMLYKSTTLIRGEKARWYRNIE